MEHVINKHDAKTQLSKLVALAQRGESVIISVQGKPAVRLVPIKPQPVFGRGRENFPDVPWSSFAPMTDGELEANFCKEFADLLSAMEGGGT